MRNENQRMLAWHDVTCPEAQECRDRILHAMSSSVVKSGILDKYHLRLVELSMEEAST